MNMVIMMIIMIIIITIIMIIMIIMIMIIIIITVILIIKQAGVPRPWMTSFCYGRALQDSCRYLS